MDFIKINYTGRIKDGQVFDTSLEDVAKKEGIYDDHRVYTSLTVVVGEGTVVEGLDEALKAMKVGGKKKVEVPPEKGYGERKSSMVKLVPIKYFKQQKINPIPGMPVEIDNMRGRVQTVSGGRVRVDFNPELAGKTLEFDVEVVEKAESDKDKLAFLVERNFQDSEGFEVKLSGQKAVLKLPKDAFHDRNLLVRKASLTAEAFKYLGFSEVTFEETWENPDKKEKKSESKKSKKK